MKKKKKRRVLSSPRKTNPFYYTVKDRITVLRKLKKLNQTNLITLRLLNQLRIHYDRLFPKRHAIKSHIGFLDFVGKTILLYGTFQQVRTFQTKNGPVTRILLKDPTIAYELKGPIPKDADAVEPYIVKEFTKPRKLDDHIWVDLSDIHFYPYGLEREFGLIEGDSLALIADVTPYRGRASSTLRKKTTKYGITKAMYYSHDILTNGGLHDALTDHYPEWNVITHFKNADTFIVTSNENPYLEMLKEGKKRGLEPSMVSYLIAAKILKDFDVPSKLVLRDFNTDLEKISTQTATMWEYFIGVYTVTDELLEKVHTKLQMAEEFGSDIIDMTIKDFLSIETIPLRKSIPIEEFNHLLNERLANNGYREIQLTEERK